MKKISLMLAVFAFLLGISIFLLIKGKPTAKNFNPLDNIDVAKVDKIVLSFPAFSVTLEKENQAWKLTSPFKDAADGAVVDRIAAEFKGMTVGSVISENKGKHGQFGVEDKTAIHAQVFVEGKKSPTLDLLIGKEGPSYMTAYVRFPGQNMVYIGNGFSTYTLQQSTDSYRLKKMLPLDLAVATSIKVAGSNTTFDLSRTSATWTRSSDGKTIETGWVDSLKNKLNALQASQFAPADTPEKDLGFLKPALDISVVVSSTVSHVVIGPAPAAKKGAPSTPPTHYGRVDGRAGVILVIPDYYVKDIQDFLKTAPK